MKIALYSIKPTYTNKILSGYKKYELRKRLPASALDYILIYSTAPSSKIVGYAQVIKVHTSSVSSLWKLVSKHAGIEKKDYLNYFKNHNQAYAFELGNIKRFKRPFELHEIQENLLPPQSFTYINKSDFDRIRKRKTETVQLKHS